MSRYVALIEKTGTGYSAHVPDLPGCIAAAESYGETVKLIHEAIEFHITAVLTRRSRNQRGKSVTMPEWASNY
jgi:predicted RNase H-like HicB family nuclease